MTIEAMILAFWRARMSLSSRLQAGLTRAWQRTAGPTDEDERAWLALAIPLILGAQKAMLRLTDAHQARVLTEMLGYPVRPMGLSPDQFTGKAVRGVDPSDVYARSIGSIRNALHDGRPYMEGYEGGLTRAIRAADTDMAIIVRDSTSVVLLREDLYLNSPKYGGRSQGGINGIVGPKYRNPLLGVRRTLSPPSCGLCASDTDTVYPPDKKMRLHVNCDCTPTPVLRDADPAAAINATRASKAVPIELHDHGEIGPILTDARYHFTELGEQQPAD